MKVGEKVLYFNRAMWIVTKRHSNLWNGEQGFYYGLCRKPNSSKVDFNNVPEKHLRELPIEAINEVQAAVAAVNHYRRIELVK